MIVMVRHDQLSSHKYKLIRAYFRESGNKKPSVAKAMEGFNLYALNAHFKEGDPQ